MRQRLCCCRSIPSREKLKFKIRYIFLTMRVWRESSQIYIPQVLDAIHSQEWRLSYALSSSAKRFLPFNYSKCKLDKWFKISIWQMTKLFSLNNHKKCRSLQKLSLNSNIITLRAKFRIFLWKFWNRKLFYQ